MSKVDLSDEDIAAMLAAEEQYIKDRKSQKQKSTRDIFHAGFHFGVAHARGVTTAPVEVPSNGAIVDEDVDDGD